MEIYKPMLFILAFVFSVQAFAQPPVTFEQAKAIAKEQVYFDRNDVGTTYCSCQWEWVGKYGGRIDFSSCGYKVRAEGQRLRAQRIEWEHIVPASNFGRARQCWQNGGRKTCKKIDPIFNLMEADLHNLTPTVGELNSDRQNFNFGDLPAAPKQHGACDFKVDFKTRVVEPRNEIKGMLARVYFYMHDRYDINMSKQQQQLLMAWNKAYPVSVWELKRNNRIETLMGHSNPFVTGEKNWLMDHKNAGEGAKTFIKINAPQISAPIIGNKNSRVYHLPTGCPSYDLVSPRNIVEFMTEDAANDAGFRKAGNCL